MAQMQPRPGQKLEAMSDLAYDLATVLANCGEAVDALDEYIEDARRANMSEAARVLEQIREDEMRHCELVRNLISDLAKQGKF